MWVVFVGSLDIANFAAFLRLAANTESPPLPVTVALLMATVVLLVGPWAYLAVRRLDDEMVAGPCGSTIGPMTSGHPATIRSNPGAGTVVELRMAMARH